MFEKDGLARELEFRKRNKVLKLDEKHDRPKSRKEVASPNKEQKVIGHTTQTIPNMILNNTEVQTAIKEKKYMSATGQKLRHQTSQESNDIQQPEKIQMTSIIKREDSPLQSKYQCNAIIRH